MTNKTGDFKMQEVKETEIEVNGYKMMAVLNDKGDYIGDKDFAGMLFKKGIKPELARPEHKVCSIGFSEKDGKWYGWSHRAIYGFEIGSKVEKGDCAYMPANKDEFLEDSLRFWGIGEYHENPKAIHTNNGVLVTATYTDTVPNEKMRGNEYQRIVPYPENYRRGEWEAKTVQDAKQMAIDFAEGVS